MKMGISVKEAAILLNIEQEKLVNEGLKAFLERKFRELRAGRLTIYLKYHVSSLKELDEKISKGELSETETLEDFSRLDFLESEEEKVKELMSKL